MARADAEISRILSVSIREFSDEVLIEEALRRKLITPDATEVAKAARALADKISEITSAEFACGAEREEREALQALLDKPVLA